MSASARERERRRRARARASAGERASARASARVFISVRGTRRAARGAQRDGPVEARGTRRAARSARREAESALRVARGAATVRRWTAAALAATGRPERGIEPQLAAESSRRRVPDSDSATGPSHPPPPSRVQRGRFVQRAPLPCRRRCRPRRPPGPQPHRRPRLCVAAGTTAALIFVGAWRGARADGAVLRDAPKSTNRRLGRD